MTNYAWKCVTCAKSYRSNKRPTRQPACPECGQLLVAVAPPTPVPQPQARFSSSSSSPASSSRGYAKSSARRSSRPSDPQQAMALVTPSSAWVPDSEPGPSPDAVGFNANPLSRFSNAIPSPSLAPAPAVVKTFPWIWASVGGVALMITIFIAFLAGRSGPKAVTAATASGAPTTPAKFQLPPAPVLQSPSPVPSTPPANPATTAVAAAAVPTTNGRTIDLLMLVDPLRDTHSGNWRLRTGELTSDATQHARLNIPYEPPEEYDFRVEFTRLAGDNCMSQIFTHQKPCCLVLYGWKGTVSGFQQLAGQGADRNQTGVRGLATANGQRHISVIKVRKNSMEAWLDGELITHYETDGADLDAKDWAIERPLGIGSQLSPTVFHRIELTEISGSGRALN